MPHLPPPLPLPPLLPHTELAKDERKGREVCKSVGDSPGPPLSCRPPSAPSCGRAEAGTSAAAHTGRGSWASSEGKPTNVVKGPPQRGQVRREGFSPRTSTLHPDLFAQSPRFGVVHSKIQALWLSRSSGRGQCEKPHGSPLASPGIPLSLHQIAHLASFPAYSWVCVTPSVQPQYHNQRVAPIWAKWLLSGRKCVCVRERQLCCVVSCCVVLCKCLLYNIPNSLLSGQCSLLSGAILVSLDAPVSPPVEEQNTSFHFKRLHFVLTLTRPHSLVFPT